MITDELRRLLAWANEGPLPAHREALLAWAAVDALPALLDCAEALRFHNQTPTGRTRKCLSGCIACAALARLDGTL
jgi:hypothetical protein